MGPHARRFALRLVLRASAASFASLAMLGLVTGLTGCGASYYGLSAAAAQARLDEARRVGAETRAPYEYYSARAHLDEAAVEASEASYSDAAHYAEAAEQFALEAIELAQARTDGAGGVAPGVAATGAAAEASEGRR